MGGQEADIALILRWFQRLADHVQAVDYVGARPLFAEDLMAFGTFADFVTARDAIEKQQWRNILGHHRPFSLPPRRPAHHHLCRPSHRCGHGRIRLDRLHRRGRTLRPTRTRDDRVQSDSRGRGLGRAAHAFLPMPRRSRALLRQQAGEDPELENRPWLLRCSKRFQQLRQRRGPCRPGLSPH
jgi:hypothetical protein